VHGLLFYLHFFSCNVHRKFGQSWVILFSFPYFFCSIKNLFLNPTEKVPSQQLKPPLDLVGPPQEGSALFSADGRLLGADGMPLEEVVYDGPVCDMCQEQPAQYRCLNPPCLGDLPGPLPIFSKRGGAGGGASLPTPVTGPCLYRLPPPAHHGTCSVFSRCCLVHVSSVS